MSRIGNKPIEIPNGVEVKVDGGNVVSVKGPKGELSERIHQDLKVEQGDGQLKVLRPTEHVRHRSQHGLARTLIQNMVLGVMNGFERALEVHGVGFRAQVEGKNLVLNVGYSHPVKVEAPDGVSFEVAAGDRSRQLQILVRGISKQKVGQVASDVRRVRPPDIYKGKGIRYSGERVKLKQGKRATA